jgi:hypothetical protein
LFQIGQFRRCEYTFVTLQEKHVCYKQEHLAHCLPVRIELVFERRTSSTSVSPSGGRLSLFKIDLLIQFQEPHMSLKRKPSVFSTGASSILVELS